ncbi:MAG: GMC family oxidoreductase N-terminal domain-containing protein [Gammaproteobacteria bacterium]|nr:GMC family oxidoreductase N-terminal domain-containing protein [Gammaproteobacteria bacterium]MDH3535825.1 GMC family oxidoreductase N-terminal domain-containing protein [Gammaproteobacteria bacterium]
MGKQQSYDYIIAGAGSAGCVLAARLCEDPAVTVCLVEAGGNGDSLFVRMPAGNGFIFGNPRFDWGYHSTAQSGLNGRRIYYPRGKGLGGTSLMNGLIYIRGNARDFDRWRDRGIRGWGYADVLPYFKKSETATYRDAEFHGQAGPLKISPAQNYCAVSRCFVTAAQQAGARLNDDFNARRQIGVGRFDAKVFNGQRQSTSATFLQRRPANLTVMTDTRALKVALSGGKAVGLQISHGGITQTLHAVREVIACLGAFESPKLLMLSGIGPADHLREFGIDVAQDLPGVGESLQDHPNMPLTFELRDPALSFARYQRLDRTIWLGLQYLFSKSGPATGPFWSVALFHAFDGGELPDIEVFCTPMVVREGAGGSGWTLQNLLQPGRAILARGKTATPGIQFDINLLRPGSKGRIRLASANPVDHPLIDPAYFSAPEDVDQLIDGVAHIREVTRQPAFAEFIGKEITFGAQVTSRTAMTDGLREHITTGHHPVASCRIGADDDPAAVLDAEFRVRGIDALRVVDASAFPDQISGNPNAGVIMMAERAADMLTGRPPPSPG